MSGGQARSEPQRRHGWLPARAVRKRPWALEEQLLAPSRAPERERRLAELAATILAERTALTRLEDELRGRFARLAALEDELRRLVRPASAPVLEPWISPDASPPGKPRATVELGAANGSADRDYWLCRCHGFRVEAGNHTVGVVQGVRFGSSATRPDTIEVRAGRLGRRELLVSVRDVEEILADDETLVVGASVAGEGDVARVLLARLRGRLESITLNG